VVKFSMFFPFPFGRHHLSEDDCLEDKREITVTIVCCVLVPQLCTVTLFVLRLVFVSVLYFVYFLLVITSAT